MYRFPLASGSDRAHFRRTSGQGNSTTYVMRGGIRK